MTLSEILLWLFIITLGTAFGAGLYETRIVLPMWFTKNTEGLNKVNLESMNHTDTGRKFWGMITTGPLTLLTIANLVLAMKSEGAIHNWWLAAALITLAERIGTFSFFIPTAIKLMKADQLAPSRVSAMIASWKTFNHLRILLNLVGWILALKVLSIWG